MEDRNIDPPESKVTYHLECKFCGYTFTSLYDDTPCLNCKGETKVTEEEYDG